MIDTFRLWLGKQSLRLATRLNPKLVRLVMCEVFMEQMHREGVVKIELGFDDDGEPAVMVQTLADLPKVTRH